MFQTGAEEGKYTEFDEEGLPAKDAEGQPLPDKTLKKMAKDSAAAKKVWDKHQEAMTKYQEAKAAWDLENAEEAPPEEKMAPVVVPVPTPAEYFASGDHEGKFTEFDDEGFPTKNDAGKKVKKDTLAELKAEYAAKKAEID